MESSYVPPGSTTGSQRRHQIPGLRRTPYLKVLLVRCDDNDSYKSSVRSEVREWIKTHTPPSSSSKKSSNQEKHDAFEWLVVHVVIPNTGAATQPWSTSSKAEGGGTEGKSSSRWRTGSTPLLEKFRSDFNNSGKGAVDHIAQIRIGINDVPYDLLPRVVPAVPSGYSETEQDAEYAWNDLVAKFKNLILSSFDRRVTQYEEDIKEKDSQRTLPGWNFCTFFILKEGLARGFENVGLVEDALVEYDELSVGLDSVVAEQAEAGSPERHGGALLSFTQDLRENIEKMLENTLGNENEEEAVDLQSRPTEKGQFEEIPISSTRKAYRDMILANNVSIFDFRCYIFSRQISLLLRLGNAQSSRDELLAKLKEQQEMVLHGVAPRAPPPQKKRNEAENLPRLAEICRRTLEFIPVVSHIMRQDMAAAIAAKGEDGLAGSLGPIQRETVDNIVASFGFSVAQQILAQTSTKALPIPPSTLPPSGGDEQKASIPEPKTMMHPARSSSLHVRPTQRAPPSPGVFPGPGRRTSVTESDWRDAQFAKAGLEELAARRADLYLLSRSILDGLGKKRGWSNGWAEAPLVGEPDVPEMEDISLDDDASDRETSVRTLASPSQVGIYSELLRTAMDNSDDFYRLYEILTDKALRHFTVAGQDYSVHASMSDLAALKFHLKEYRAATSYFCLTTPFFGEGGWSWLELSMLVMYSHCLKEMQSQEYVRVSLKLLTKACAAEKEWLQEKTSFLFRGEIKELPDMSPIAEAVGSMTDLAKMVPNDAKVPLGSFFTDIELAGPPQYRESRDSCGVVIQLRSLLPGSINIDSAALRLSSTDGGPCKELWFKLDRESSLSRGKNTLEVECKVRNSVAFFFYCCIPCLQPQTIVPGNYRIDHLSLSSGNLVLHFDRDVQQTTSAVETIFKKPDIMLYQRPDALDVRLSASKDTALNKNNSLDLTLSTGWNSLVGCDIRVKPATGGLRLLTTDAAFVDSANRFAKPPEAGVFYLGSVAANASVIVRFPYTVEQDVGVVAARLEVSYKTDSGESFYLAKFSSIPIALPLNVSVQDVFKHDFLFSRFSVSTATSSPLRLYESELIESDLFESSFGAPPSSTVRVFSNQPATLLYRVKRKTAGQPGKGSGKTMYLKLYYNQLDSEIEQLILFTLAKSLEKSPLASYRRVINAILVDHVRTGLQGHDLERAALLNEVSTNFLSSISWKHHFTGVGIAPGTEDDVGTAVSAFFDDWLEANPRVAIPSSSVTGKASILIPVEIPSVSVVHTAEIRLQKPLPDPLAEKSGGTPVVVIGQVLSATLHLKWTRVWGTETIRPEDKEFSYEISAPGEAWLLGGRRKGHFVIPGDSSISSMPDTEAEIPLMLIPQREGWLSYPNVEIKELSAGGEVLEPHLQTFEIDFRNLGETVRVIGGRKGVTVSLDASGPGGGPLVLDCPRMKAGDKSMVA